MVRLFALFILLLTGLYMGSAAVPGTQAWAQSASYKSQEINPGRLYVSLHRDPALPAEHVVLRLALNTMITGCPKIGALEYETNYSGSHLNITLKNYTMDMKDLPRNPHYECGGSHATPAASITLNKDDLAARGIKVIRLRTDGVSDFYDVKLTDHKLKLEPSEINMMESARYYKPLPSAKISDPLEHWFYPENTVILYAPDAKDDQDIAGQIHALAQKNTLTPLEDIYPDFISPVIGADYFYYVDNSGDLAANTEAYKGTQIGTVTVKERVFGLEHDYTKEKELPVYAKKPGMYE